MTGKCAFLGIVAAGLIWSGAVRAADLPPPAAKPNIVLLLADDLRWDCLGCAGDPVIRTPNIDALAKRGVMFRQSFVTTPICAVSRASTFTGQYARQHGVNDFSTPIKDLAKTYPSILRSAGYYTGFIGKWGVAAGDVEYVRDCARSFDYWGGDRDQTSYWHEQTCNYVLNSGTTNRENYHCSCPEVVWEAQGTQGSGPHPLLQDPVHLETWVIPHKVRQFLDQRNPYKPFNLSVSFKSPHGPLGGFAPQFASRFEGVNMPFRANANSEEAERQPDFLKNSLEGPRGREMAKNQGLNSKSQEELRNYYRLVEGLDQSVGEIVKELRKRDLLENTIIIFTSDNGHLHGEHGFYGKWLLYEESIRVPLIINDPRMAAQHGGLKCDAVALNVDLAPTILGFAEVPIPDGMQGYSLKPLLAAPGQPFRDSFFCDIFMNTRQCHPCTSSRPRDSVPKSGSISITSSSRVHRAKSYIISRRIHWK